MANLGRKLNRWLLVVAVAATLPLGAAGSALALPPYPEFCDVNGDANTTIVDAGLIAQGVVGLININLQPGDCKGDVNNDGKSTITDGLLVAQHVVGLI